MHSICCMMHVMDIHIFIIFIFIYSGCIHIVYIFIKYDLFLWLFLYFHIPHTKSNSCEKARKDSDSDDVYCVVSHYYMYLFIYLFFWRSAWTFTQPCALSKTITCMHCCDTCSTFPHWMEHAEQLNCFLSWGCMVMELSLVSPAGRLWCLATGHFSQ